MDYQLAGAVMEVADQVVKVGESDTGRSERHARNARQGASEPPEVSVTRAPLCSAFDFIRADTDFAQHLNEVAICGLNEYQRMLGRLAEGPQVGRDWRTPCDGTRLLKISG